MGDKGLKMAKKKAVIKKVTIKKEVIKLKPVKHAKKIGAKKGKLKIKRVMEEFKEHKLHSGSKKGPEVTNPKQAIAIALSEARKEGAKIPKKKKRAKK